MSRTGYVVYSFGVGKFKVMILVYFMRVKFYSYFFLLVFRIFFFLLERDLFVIKLFFKIWDKEIEFFMGFCLFRKVEFFFLF